MPLGKKWRSMDVLFGSNKDKEGHLSSSRGSLFGSRENISTGSSKSDSRENLFLDYNRNNTHGHGRRHGQSHSSHSLKKNRLGSLSNVKEDQSSPRKDEGGGDSNAVYIQRSVIIQRDERGYGLTVRGDNPVYVESVKADGAAARAGVQTGDRIIKVNGTLVTNSNHIEVVKLIKSGSFVALTLLNKPVGGTTTVNDRPPGERTSVGGVIGPPKEIVTAPQPVDENKTRELEEAKQNELRKYYQIAEEEYEKLKKQHQKNPSEKLHAQLLEKEKTLKVLAEKLQIPLKTETENEQVDQNSNAPWLKGGPKHFKHVSTPVTIYSSNDVPETRYIGVSRSASDAGTRHKLSDSRKSNRLTSTFRKGDISPEAQSLPNTTTSNLDESPSTSPSASPTPTHPSNVDSMDVDKEVDESDQNSNRKNRQIIAMEEDEFDSDEEHTDDHGPFSDLKMLELRPAHMAVFLNYLMSTPSADPSPTYFFLISNIYCQAGGNIKQLLKWAVEIHSSFLVIGAPLKVEIDDKVIQRIDSTLIQKADKEDALRSIFLEARSAIMPEIQSQLNEFRHKKDIQGLGNMYGAQDLKDVMKKPEEIEIMSKILSPHLDRLIPRESEENVKSDRDLAMGWSLATFLRSVGVNKHSASVERIQSFVMKDKRGIRLGSGQSKKRPHRGHQFTPIHLSKVEFCMYCQSVIWGVGYQGYQCSMCESYIHKHCIDDLDENCLRKKVKRTSGLMSGFRKSTPAIPNIKDSDKESGSPGPQANTVFNIQAVKDEDEQDLANIRDGQPVHSVNRLVDRFNQIDQVAPEPVQKKTDLGRSESLKGRGDQRGDKPTCRAKREGTDLGRSESLKGKNDKRGKRPTRRAKSDVDMDENALKALNNSGSSSTSSLSNRSVESPSNSMDSVNTILQTVADDSDFDIETELPPLKEILPEEVFKKLKPKERKRQEVINELFYTERSHVRNLKILELLFYKPMSQDHNIPQDFVKTLFPNIKDLIQLHSYLNNEMKTRKKEGPVVKEVGDVLLKRFDSDEGETFRAGCAIYCRNQAHALEALKHRRKDPRLMQFLNEAESSNLMRKLQLKDFIPMQMMRLTKYPLLIENLMKYTQTQGDEYSRLERALQCCKHILEYVNQAVKEYENHYKLEQLQRRIDKKTADSNFEDLKHLDLTKHKLVYEGVLTWNINVKKSVDVHVVLLEDMLVLLQKQDDKLVLKMQSTMLVAGKEDSKYMFNPVLKLNFILHTNGKATDKKTFFVVSKQQIYELSASTADEQRKWCKFIKDAADAFKSKHIRSSASTPVQPPEFIVSDRDQIRRPSASDSMKTDDQTGQPFQTQQHLDVSQEPDLAQPEEVIVNDATTAIAEPVLTPLETVRRYDDIVQQTMEKKKKVISEMLGVPVVVTPSHTQELLDTGEYTTEELLIAGIQESSHCINELNAKESGLAKEDLTLPIPMDKLREMACRMNQILTNLLEKSRAYAALNAGQSLPHSSSAVVNSRDEERERLRIELKAAQDELNYLREIQRRVSSSSPPDIKVERPASYVSEGSSCSEDDGTIKPSADSDGNIVPEEAEKVQTENVMEDDSDMEPEPEEPDVVIPTEIPKDLQDLPAEPLQETEPPDEDTVEDVDPPFISEQDLINSDEMQEAEVRNIDEEVEEVTEMFDQIVNEVAEEETENDQDNGVESTDLIKRCDSNEDYKDASDNFDESEQVTNVDETEKPNVVSEDCDDEKCDNLIDLTDMEKESEPNSVPNDDEQTVSKENTECNTDECDEKHDEQTDKGDDDSESKKIVSQQNESSTDDIDEPLSQDETCVDLIHTPDPDSNENKLHCENENKTYEQSLDGSISLSGTEDMPGSMEI